MSCRVVDLGNVVAITCDRNSAPLKRCVVCKTEEATKLCDGPQAHKVIGKKRVDLIDVLTIDCERDGSTFFARADRDRVVCPRCRSETTLTAIAGETLCSAPMCAVCAVGSSGNDFCPLCVVVAGTVAEAVPVPLSDAASAPELKPVDQQQPKLRLVHVPVAAVAESKKTGYQIIEDF